MVFAVVVALVGVLARDYETVFVADFFSLVLPFANALADWLSWGVTRWLLHRAAHAKNAAVIFCELAVDLVFAYLCLMLLAALLPALIELFNLLMADSGVTPIDWRGLINAALQKPFYEELLLWGMLFTTLIPTILHLIAGLIGLVAVTASHGTRVAEEIEAVQELNEYARQTISPRVFAARTGGWRALAVIFFVTAAAFAYFSLVEIHLLGVSLLYIADAATFWAR